MFRALTDEELATVRVAKDRANAELKRPRQEALAQNAEIRKTNKGLPRSLKQPYVKVPDTPTLITGQPVWLHVVGNSFDSRYIQVLLVDYDQIRKYVRKLKQPDWRLKATSVLGQRGQALEIRYWRVEGGQQGRVVFEQIGEHHRSVLVRQTLPEAIFIESWAA